MLPLIKWPGGKTSELPVIKKYLPEKYSRYVEPFFGGGAIYFAREKWAPCEIINDLNDDIINLYRIVKERGEEFAREFNFVFSSRSFFNRMKEFTPPKKIINIFKHLELYIC